MKLIKLGCKGYKPFREHEELNIRPLTILFGKNNSGKTALMRLSRLLLRYLSPRVGQGFPLDVDNITFGSSFRSLIHQENIHGQVAFEIELEDEGHGLAIRATIQNLVDVHSGKDDQVVSNFEMPEPGILLEWERSRTKPARYKNIGGEVIFNGLLPVSGNGLSLPADYFEEWRKLIQLFEKAVTHIGALRAGISPVYQKGGSRPIGLDGGGAPGLLAEHAELLEAVGDWYEKNMDGWRLSLDSAGSAFRCVLQRGAVVVNLADSGQGMQQLLPIVVQQLAHRLNGHSEFLDLVEEPELHLHPAAHAPLADLFLASIQNRTGQVLVETHSENLLLRVRRRVAEGINPSLVAIYWIEDMADGSSTVRPIQIKADGSVDYWPPGIFSEGYQEVRALRRAAREHNDKGGLS